MRVNSSIFSSDGARFAVRAIVLAVLVVMTCGLIHRTDRFADVDVVGDKLAYFERHSSDYDVVFVGSSYVYREVSPSEFDSVTNTKGSPTASFNFGIPGMDPPETYFLVDRILDARSSRLRCIVIELDYFRSDVRERNVHTRRFDYWHDAGRTEEVERDLVDSSVSIGKRVKDFGAHLEAFAREFVAVGRGRSLLEARLGDAASSPESLGPNADGFRSLDDESARRFEYRQGFYQALEGDRYEEKLAELRAGRNAEDENERAGRMDFVALRETVERSRARGIRCVLVVPPCLAPRADLTTLADAVGAPVFAFNDPNAFPELYDPSNRFDVGHLNAQGAALFTRLLAERFATLGYEN